jgi:ABC-2 type transport system ATP-binding protein
MSGDTIIEITGLQKLYKGASEPAVKNISLSISRNEIFGILGPNGAGKTTTISMLCGIFAPTAGKINVDGMTFENNREEIKKIIGVVPQDMALYPTLTARENLSFFGHMFGLHGKELRDRINDCLDIFGLEKNADKRVSKFSGGMKRRVNLIAGILHKPKILFLDEPTVGIDVQSRNVIRDFLNDLNKSGTTIIYTSHHLEEAETFCNRVAIIDNGQIITLGTPFDLIRNHGEAQSLEDVFLQITGVKLRDLNYA